MYFNRVCKNSGVNIIVLNLSRGKGNDCCEELVLGKEKVVGLWIIVYLYPVVKLK